MSLTVAILAGGLATRLGDITRQIPKSLLEVAGCSFVEHQLKLLRRHKIEKVVFCVGYLGEQIEAALGDGNRFGLSIKYSYDGPRLLGTGGALRRALPLLGEAFFILYGDSYLDCDYEQIERAFWASGKSGLMAVYRNQNRWDKSNVLFQEGRIFLYDKKNQTAAMQHIDYGLGVMKTDALAVHPSDHSFDLETIYQDLLSRNQLAGFEADQRFYEIGSPTGLSELRALLESPTMHS